jgi:predicted phage terminase large subunit-like protein
MISVEQLLLSVEREACTNSFYEFLLSFWGVIIPEELVDNWHIKYLCDELQELAYYIVNRLEKPYDVIVNVPPGSTKSTITTIMFPVWLWTQDQTIKIITNSYSADLAVSLASKSRDIIMSEKFKRLYPHIELRRDVSAKSNYENTATGARYSTSTGATITGKHAHIIINDDASSPMQAQSEAERKNAIEHVRTLSSRKVDKKNTPMITIMQRLHENDVTGYLLTLGTEVKHICLPAEVSSRVSPAELKEKYVDGLLDPIRISREIIKAQKIELGSQGFSGQYEQNPVAEGGNIVKRDWFNNISLSEFNRKRTNEPMDFLVDTAFTDSTKNDPTGIIGVCRIDNKIYITSAHCIYANFPDLVKFIKKFTADNGYKQNSTIRIEPKASGLSVVQQLREVSQLNVVDIKSIFVSQSKTTNLSTVSPLIECGRVILIEAHWNDEFVEQICGFPNKKHDEYVDLISYAVDIYLLNERKINVSRLAAAAY